MVDFSYFVSNSTGEMNQDYTDIIHQIGDVLAALVYFKLFFPDFLLIDDSVIRDDNSPKLHERFTVARKNSISPVYELEKSFNYVEVLYLFHFNDVSDVVEMKIAEALVTAWSLKLLKEFPARRFDFSILSPEESGSVRMVTFCERR